MRLKRYLILAGTAVLGAYMAILAMDAINYFWQSRTTTLPAVEDRQLWKAVTSARWDFSALLPQAFEHEETSVNTPFGDAPLETWHGNISRVRYTIAVAEYDALIAKNFPEEDRYNSAAEETPKQLGGKLVRNDRIRLGEFEGREKVIVVPDKVSIHSREFLIGNRSYQVQIAYPPGCEPVATDQERFLDSLKIDYRPAKK